jgi:alpha-glucosidase (family GH31 glycosyl hydrolase)
MGLSGISSWGSDIGGFFSLGFRRLTPELLVRWIEVGAVSGVMRTKAGGVDIPPKGGRPQVWDPEILPHWRRYARLRTSLYPYVVAANAAYRETGLPVMRHLALAYPGDPRATGREDEFLFGPDLLAAPVLAPGARERRLYLPAGNWIRLDPDLAGAGGELLAGGREVTVPAALGELPLFVRAGSVLPLLPEDVDTLADYGAGNVVRLADRRGSMRLLAFPHGRRTSRMGERGRLTSVARRGSWQLAIRDSRRRRYDLQAALGFRPCAVAVGGRRLRRSAWSFADGVLRATFRVRSGRLRVKSRC